MANAVHRANRRRMATPGVKRSAAHAQLDEILAQANVSEQVKARLEVALIDWKLSADEETAELQPRHKRMCNVSPEAPPQALDQPAQPAQPTEPTEPAHTPADHLRLRTSDGHEELVDVNSFALISMWAANLLDMNSQPGGTSVTLPAWLTADSLRHVADYCDFHARLCSMDHGEFGAEELGQAHAEAEAEFLASLDFGRLLGLLRAASFFEAERLQTLAGLSVCSRLLKWPIEAVIDLIPSLQTKGETVRYARPHTTASAAALVAEAAAQAAAADAAAAEAAKVTPLPSEASSAVSLGKLDAAALAQTAAALVAKLEDSDRNARQASVAAGAAKLAAINAAVAAQNVAAPVTEDEVPGMVRSGPRPMPQMAYEFDVIDVLDSLMAKLDEEFVMCWLDYPPTADLALGALKLKRLVAQRTTERILHGLQPDISFHRGPLTIGHQLMTKAAVLDTRVKEAQRRRQTTSSGELAIGHFAMGDRFRGLWASAVGLAMVRKRFPNDDNQGWAGVSLREIDLFKGELCHPNIVALKAVVLKNMRKDATPIFVYEWVPCAVGKDLLSRVARAHGAVSLPSVRAIMFQTLRGLAHLHEHGVIHRRINREYVQFNPHSGAVKLGGSGQARRVELDDCPHPLGRAMTIFEYWETTLAPELLLQPSCTEWASDCTGHRVGVARYGLAIDVWKIGILLIELLCNGDDEQTVFEVGTQDRLSTLYSYFRLLGTPTPATWPGLGALVNPLAIHPLALTAPIEGEGGDDDASWAPTQLDTSWPEQAARAWPQWQPRELACVLPTLDADGVDLLRRLLQLDPARRITAAAALRHPFFASVERRRVGTAPLPEMQAARAHVDAWLDAALPAFPAESRGQLCSHASIREEPSQEIPDDPISETP